MVGHIVVAIEAVVGVVAVAVVYLLLLLLLLFFLFSSLLLSSLTLPVSAFHLSILSEVWLRNFLR